MDPLVLARLQFAITTIYHFFFVPLTLGLSVLVAVMETLYVRTGNETYKRMTKFWGKLFLINFAMGVVTGIVQEFQFGMNWSEYSRIVGDIFGAPLAIEATLAFFLESTFLGIWVFGWEKLSKGLHATAMWMVAIGSNISALWILIANAFMQHPVGYDILPTGQAVMTDFFALVFNPNVWYAFSHTLLSGFVTACFFILGISAYHLVRKNEPDVFRRSFQMAVIVGTVATILLAANGHAQTQHIMVTQPMKMASAEALWESENPASFSLLTIPDTANRKDIFAIRIPKVLSLLAYNRLDGEVKGVRNLQAEYEATYGPGDYVPPILIPYWSFRVMVGAGFAMIGIALFALVFMVRGGKYEKYSRILKLFPFVIALPYLANTAGWLLTEVGRFPWVVFGLVKVEDGVTPSSVVTPGMLWVSLIGYVLIYGALIVATIYLMRKFAMAGPAATDHESSAPSAAQK